MSILSPITRNLSSDYNIVRMDSNDTLSTVTTTGYFVTNSIHNDIRRLNNGEFEWQTKDVIFLYNEIEFVGLFTYNASRDALDMLLVNKERNSWTPSASFITEGDLSVEYLIQNGSWTVSGNEVTLRFNMRFTPTYITASGAFIVSGFPMPVGANIGGIMERTSDGPAANIVYPTGRTWLTNVAVTDQTYGFIRAIGSNSDDLILADTEIISGSEYFLIGSYKYFV